VRRSEGVVCLVAILMNGASLSLGIDSVGMMKLL